MLGRLSACACGWMLLCSNYSTPSSCQPVVPNVSPRPTYLCVFPEMVGCHRPLMPSISPPIKPPPRHVLPIPPQLLTDHSRKLSLGLLSPSDLEESGPAFFADIVALLSEADSTPSSSVGDRSSDSSSDRSSVGLVLNLCALLAKVNADNVFGLSRM